MLIANAAAGQIQARKVPAARIIKKGSNRRSQLRQGGKRREKEFPAGT
jgi:hypothetical protein